MGPLDFFPEKKSAGWREESISLKELEWLLGGPHPSVLITDLEFKSVWKQELMSKLFYGQGWKHLGTVQVWCCKLVQLPVTVMEICVNASIDYSPRGIWVQKAAWIMGRCWPVQVSCSLLQLLSPHRVWTWLSSVMYICIGQAAIFPYYSEGIYLHFKQRFQGGF